MTMEKHMDWRRSFGRRRVAAPEIKDSRTGPLIALTGAGRPRWTPRDYAHLADEGFGKNAVAYRCVRMIAEAAASTPLMVMVGGVRSAEHPLARLIDKPNPEQSGGELMEALYGALQTAGNAYVEATGDGRRRRGRGAGRAVGAEARPGEGGSGTGGLAGSL